MGFLKTFKVVIVFIAVFYALDTLAQTWVSLDGSQGPNKPGIDIIYSDYDSTIIDVSVRGFYSKDTTIDNTTYKIISVPGSGTTDSIGLPRLPLVYSIIGVPPNLGVSLAIIDTVDTAFANMLVFSYQGIDTSDKFHMDATRLLRTRHYTGIIMRRIF